MSDVAEQLNRLNRLVHEPARLAILTALASCRKSDFLFLERLTGLTRGNLSSHLAKLEEAGLISIEKRFLGKRPNTLLSITPSGARAIDAHWQRLEELRKGVTGAEFTNSLARSPNSADEAPR